MEAKQSAAATWFGYGRWDAPFWFIGKEPGGADDLEQYASWQRLGAGDLIDCREHDLDCPADRKPGMWHGGVQPPMQQTWRPLIAMLLAYEGATLYDAEAIRRYQNERWGRRDGETAVLELSAIAARSVSHEEAMRLTSLPDRIATIRRHLAETPPTFVVFYGLGTDPVHNVPYLEHWRAIAQYDLAVGEPVLVGETVFVVEKHPTAHGLTNEHWIDLGRRVRALVESRLADRFRAPSELERAFLRAVTDGYPELHEQIESCLVADYDSDGYCDVQILDGPPTCKRMDHYDGPSLVSDNPDSPLVETILWVDERGFLDNVEIVDYGGQRDDAYQRFVAAAAESRLTYHVDR